MDSPYFQKQVHTACQQTQCSPGAFTEASTQTSFSIPDLLSQVARYESQLRKESIASAELSEELAALQLEVHGLRQERDGLALKLREAASALEAEKAAGREEAERLRAQLLELENCDSCLEYIKQMKALEFRLADVDRAAKARHGEAAERGRQAEQVNEVLRREVDRLRKKAEVGEAVIAQLKKELERYAYELIKMQEIHKQPGNLRNI